MTTIYNWIVTFSMVIWLIKSVKMDPLNWMQQLNDCSTYSPRINAINIPGTHESAANTGWHGLKRWFTCNVYGLHQQLQWGYRFFDIRLKNKNDFGVYHMVAAQGLTWNGLNWKVIHTIFREFLKQHPGEVIIVKVKDESKSKGETAAKFGKDFAIMIEEYGTKEKNNIYFLQTTSRKSAIPTLKEAAGKVVILPLGEWKDETSVKQKFLDWEDPIFAKGADQMQWEERESRKDKWIDAVEQTGRERPDENSIKFFRNGINANTMGNMKKLPKTMWKALTTAHAGNPLEWATFMNPIALETLTELSFGRSSGSPPQCLNVFYGDITIDIPSTDLLVLKPREIAAVIIMSNCELYNSVTGPKDFVKDSTAAMDNLMVDGTNPADNTCIKKAKRMSRFEGIYVELSANRNDYGDSYDTFNEYKYYENDGYDNGYYHYNEYVTNYGLLMLFSLLLLIGIGIFCVIYGFCIGYVVTKWRTNDNKVIFSSIPLDNMEESV
eukprot:131448_1